MSLNTFQQQIVDWGLTGEDGTARVLAVAGSGKTTTMVELVRQAVLAKTCAPHEILMTTFTRAGRGALVKKIKRALGDQEKGLRIGTFHALAKSYLQEKKLAGWTPQTQITLDIEYVIKQLLRKPWVKKDKTGGMTWTPVDGFQKFYGFAAKDESDDLPESITTTISLARSLGIRCTTAGVLEGNLGPELIPLIQQIKDKVLLDLKEASIAIDYEDLANYVLLGELREPGKNPVKNPTSISPLLVWTWYERWKAMQGVKDFDDALYDYWNEGQDSARMVIVDECQDNTWIQLDIARKLWERGQGKLIIVGDISQAIYEWRGAMPVITQEADKTLNARTFTMPINYRSALAGIDMGNAICHTEFPVDEDTEFMSWAISGEAIQGRPASEIGFIGLKGFQTPWEEAQWTADEIKARIDGGLAPCRIAILLRANAMLGAYELALLKRKIQVLRVASGGNPFFGRPEIRAAMSMIRLANGNYETIKPAGRDAKPGEMLEDILFNIFKVTCGFKLHHKKISTYVSGMRATWEDVTNTVRNLARGVVFRDLKGEWGWQKPWGDWESFHGKVYGKDFRILRSFAEAIEDLKGLTWKDQVEAVCAFYGRLAEDALRAKDLKVKVQTQAQAQAQAASDSPDTTSDFFNAFKDIALEFESMAEILAFAEKSEEEVASISGAGGEEIELDDVTYRNTPQAYMVLEKLVTGLKLIPKRIMELLGTPFYDQSVRAKVYPSSENVQGALAEFAPDLPNLLDLPRVNAWIKEKLNAKVVISTIHRSKGLDWDTVFVSTSAGVFPNPMADLKGEEQRLFYVACTRMENTLWITWNQAKSDEDISEYVSEYAQPYERKFKVIQESQIIKAQAPQATGPGWKWAETFSWRDIYKKTEIVEWSPVSMPYPRLAISKSGSSGYLVDANGRQNSTRVGEATDLTEAITLAKRHMTENPGPDTRLSADVDLEGFLTYLESCHEVGGEALANHLRSHLADLTPLIQGLERAEGVPTTPIKDLWALIHDMSGPNLDYTTASGAVVTDDSEGPEVPIAVTWYGENGLWWCGDLTPIKRPKSFSFYPATLEVPEDVVFSTPLGRQTASFSGPVYMDGSGVLLQKLAELPPSPKPPGPPPKSPKKAPPKTQTTSQTPAINPPSLPKTRAPRTRDGKNESYLAVFPDGSAWLENIKTSVGSLGSTDFTSPTKVTDEIFEGLEPLDSAIHTILQAKRNSSRQMIVTERILARKGSKREKDSWTERTTRVDADVQDAILMVMHEAVGLSDGWVPGVDNETSGAFRGAKDWKDLKENLTELDVDLRRFPNALSRNLESVFTEWLEIRNGDKDYSDPIDMAKDGFLTGIGIPDSTHWYWDDSTESSLDTYLTAYMKEHGGDTVQRYKALCSKPEMVELLTALPRWATEYSQLTAELAILYPDAVFPDARRVMIMRGLAPMDVGRAPLFSGVPQSMTLQSMEDVAKAQGLISEGGSPPERIMRSLGFPSVLPAVIPLNLHLWAITDMRGDWLSASLSGTLETISKNEINEALQVLRDQLEEGYAADPNPIDHTNPSPDLAQKRAWHTRILPTDDSLRAEKQMRVMEAQSQDTTDLWASIRQALNSAGKTDDKIQAYCLKRLEIALGNWVREHGITEAGLDVEVGITISKNIVAHLFDVPGAPYFQERAFSAAPDRAQAFRFHYATYLVPPSQKLDPPKTQEKIEAPKATQISDELALEASSGNEWVEMIRGSLEAIKKGIEELKDTDIDGLRVVVPESGRILDEYTWSRSGFDAIPDLPGAPTGVSTTSDPEWAGLDTVRVPGWTLDREMGAPRMRWLKGNGRAVVVTRKSYGQGIVYRVQNHIPFGTHLGDDFLDVQTARKEVEALMRSPDPRDMVILQMQDWQDGVNPDSLARVSMDTRWAPIPEGKVTQPGHIVWEKGPLGDQIHLFKARRLPTWTIEFYREEVDAKTGRHRGWVSEVAWGAESEPEALALIGNLMSKSMTPVKPMESEKAATPTRTQYETQEGQQEPKKMGRPKGKKQVQVKK